MSMLALENHTLVVASWKQSNSRTFKGNFYIMMLNIISIQEVERHAVSCNRPHFTPVFPYCFP